MDMIGRQNGARLYLRVFYISEDDDGLIDLLRKLYTLSNFVPLGPWVSNKLYCNILQFNCNIYIVLCP